MTDLPTNQSNGFQLSQQELERRADHREWIAGRVYVLLGHYWQSDMTDAEAAEIMADWADVLEGIPAEYIAKACKRYLIDEPRRKPTPGAIYQIARSYMPRPQVVLQKPVPEVQRERCEPEIAQRICEEAGFTPKRFGGEND